MGAGWEESCEDAAAAQGSGVGMRMFTSLIRFAYSFLEQPINIK